jgi:hypothetical protein
MHVHIVAEVPDEHASLSGQSPSDLLMGLELAGVQSCANLAAIGAKRRTSLDEIVDQTIIERHQRIRAPVYGFEQNPLGAGGLEDLADRRLGFADWLDDHDGPPS